METLLLPLLSALTQAASLILHKVGLAKRHIALKQYVPLLFLFLTGYTLLTFPFLGWISQDFALSGRNIAYLTLIIACGIAWNYFYFTAIKTEQVNLVENIISLSPILTIGAAFIFTPQHFDVRIGLAGAIATGAMVWGYWHRHKLQFSRNAILLFLAVFFMALENVLVGSLLQERTMSPVVLFALRTTIMFGFFSLYYKTDFRAFTKQQVGFIGAVATLGTAMMLLRFYGLRDSGIVFTSLILILVPFIVFVASGIILHEKLRFKQALAICIVILCVLYATIITAAL